mmetsp:Transcript_24011/g.28046  ORF Transcript_24011/g.28046 Transcript_24011/m.28046 type:complete len:115 (-) Transcript_24011:2126-2470(-)
MIKAVTDEENSSGEKAEDDDADADCQSSKSSASSHHAPRENHKNMKRVLSSTSFKDGHSATSSSHAKASTNYRVNRHTPKGTVKMGSVSRMIEDKEQYDEFFIADRQNGINSTT